MKKKILFLLVTCYLLLVASTPVLAKKKLFSAPAASGSRTYAPTAGVIVRPRLRADRRALLVDFSLLSRASSVAYTLSYTANGVSQGVSGTITSSENTSRELLFGTCSHGVCRYHQNITGMKFIVTSYLKSGKRVVKTFRVKP